MAMKKRVPEIRFQGFSGEWEERSLGDVLLVQRGGSPRPIESFITTSDEGINWIKIGDVDTESRYITATKEKIIPAGEKKSRRVFVGDLILSNSMSFGRPYIMKIEGCIHDGWLLIRDDKKLFDIEYLLQLLSSSSMLRQYKSLAAGGVVINLNSDLVQSTNVLFPTKHEQSKIGSFFQNLDAQITLHQRKLSKLGAVKKSMLEKMFPREGAAVPEIRFQGFTGKWERKKWVDVVDISTNMVNPNEGKYDELFHIGPGNIESFTGRILNNILKVKDCELISGKFHFNQGDIIYGKIRPNLAKYTVAPYEGLTSADAYVLNAKNGLVQSFLFTVLHTTDFYDYSVSVSARTGMPKINRDELNQFSIILPTNTVEQSQIGSFFTQLDSLINLQQRELDKLKNIKQACLAKMFV